MVGMIADIYKLAQEHVTDYCWENWGMHMSESGPMAYQPMLETIINWDKLTSVPRTPYVWGAYVTAVQACYGAQRKATVQEATEALAWLDSPHCPDCRACTLEARATMQCYNCYVAEHEFNQPHQLGYI